MAIVLIGNEVTKEGHTDQATGVMTTKAGKPVSVEAAQSFTDLASLLAADIPTPLSYLKELEFGTSWTAGPDSGSKTRDMWRVAGYSRKCPEGAASCAASE